MIRRPNLDGTGAAARRHRRPEQQPEQQLARVEQPEQQLAVHDE